MNMTSINLTYNSCMTQDGRLIIVEVQPMAPVLDSREMETIASSNSKVVTRHVTERRPVTGYILARRTGML